MLASLSLAGIMSFLTENEKFSFLEFPSSWHERDGSKFFLIGLTIIIMERRLNLIKCGG